MPLTTKPLDRVFKLSSGVRLADPSPQMSIPEVQAFYAGTYPELNNASFEEKTTDKSVTVTFITGIGSKG